MRKLITLALATLLCSTPAWAIPQPCFPFQTFLSVFEHVNSVLDDSYELERRFFTAGKSANVDPRYLITYTCLETGCGDVGSECNIIHHNPFHFPGHGNCQDFDSYNTAIAFVANHISANYLGLGKSLIRDIYPILCETCDTGHFERVYAQLLGRPSIPVYYSSSCCGDCNHNVSVEINELIYIINLTLCSKNCPAISTCQLGDADFDGKMQITDVIRGVLSALGGPCPSA